MDVTNMRAARANICRALELASHETGKEAKNASPELKKAFNDAETALELLYAKICHAIVWRDKNA